MGEVVALIFVAVLVATKKYTGLPRCILTATRIGKNAEAIKIGVSSESGSMTLHEASLNQQIHPFMGSIKMLKQSRLIEGEEINRLT